MITPEEVKAKTPERFWSKIKFGEPTECWEWQSSKNTAGYGTFSNGKENSRLATRNIFKYVRSDEFDVSLNVCHSCDNPPCVNPNHLWIGTQRQNAGDMKRKGRGRGWDSHGENNGMAKLTDKLVKEIRKKYSNGKNPIRKLAREYGVAKSLIWRIKQGIVWKHI